MPCNLCVTVIPRKISMLAHDRHSSLGLPIPLIFQREIFPVSDIVIIDYI
jgi:hypothetical protein